MSENVRYWLWLQRALGEGANIKPVIDDFGSAKKLYEANILEWKMSTSLTARQINRLEETKLTVADEIIYICNENGWQIIDYEDSLYPGRLKEIINPPAVLYVDGTMPDVDDMITIGIVGTRKASEYAVKVTHIMSRGIAQAGVLVVSGGALGVDTYAHRGAIAAGGKTIAVLGCGLGTKYLSQNSSLRDMIKKYGALVTEFEPFTPAGKRTFPIRNRIISGLSLGVLVVEAGEKSGSLITARYALEQNRDVYAVPASVLSTNFSGTNRLIDDGARVVTLPVHLIESYLSDYPGADPSKIGSIEELASEETDKSANVEEKEDKYSFDTLEKGRKNRLEREEKERNLDGDLKTVYDSVGDNFTHIDMIIEKSGLSSQKVTASVIQLEMLGIIESASGKRYKKA